MLFYLVVTHSSNIKRSYGQKAVAGVTVYLSLYCLILMKHCITFSFKQPEIPFRNRNSTAFLYLFILVNATEIKQYNVQTKIDVFKVCKAKKHVKCYHIIHDSTNYSHIYFYVCEIKDLLIKK